MTDWNELADKYERDRYIDLSWDFDSDEIEAVVAAFALRPMGHHRP